MINRIFATMLMVWGLNPTPLGAHIERQWMHLKRCMRPDLNEEIGHREVLLRKEWHRFTVHDARKTARHCRNTMRAYQVLGDSVSLHKLQEEQKRQKGHRKVVDV